MKISELEETVGMTRANIRFYEAEGLLSPHRNENGYREYSAEDRETLERIRLLRILGVSIEEIRMLQSGEKQLTDVLAHSLKMLEKKQNETIAARRICRQAYENREEYKSLDAGKYMQLLQNGSGTDTPLPQEDAIRPLRAPVRRYFARMLDLFVCGTVWTVIRILVFHRNPGLDNIGDRLFNIIAESLMMLAAEPFLLSRFGTTPGKALLGLSVQSEESRPLTYQEALERTWKLFRYGLGFQIPVWSLYRIWKSYQACRNGETAEWEEGSVLSLKDEKPYRYILYAGSCAACIAMTAGALMLGYRPKYHGDLTLQQFTQNYNQISSFTQNGPERMDSEGRLYFPGNENVIITGGDESLPEFTYKEENGFLKEAVMSSKSEEGVHVVGYYISRMKLLSLAFTGESPYSQNGKEMIEMLRGYRFDDFTWSSDEYTITCSTEYSGYDLYQAKHGFLFPEENSDTSFSMIFTIRKN